MADKPNITIPPRAQRKCSVDDCEKPVHSRGLCGAHYMRLRTSGGLPNSKPCSVVGCEFMAYSKGLCTMHWTRLRKDGVPGEAARRAAPRGELKRWIAAHVSHKGEECLIWPFGKMADGRAERFRHENGMVEATRYMCELAHGAPPFPRAQAAHSCGNGHKACIHPNHLRWATKKQNEADKHIHGTRSRGEAHPWAKLTEAQARMVLDDPRDDAELARALGVSGATIGMIRRRQNWRHLG